MTKYPRKVSASCVLPSSLQVLLVARSELELLGREVKPGLFSDESPRCFAQQSHCWRSVLAMDKDSHFSTPLPTLLSSFVSFEVGV